MKRPSLLSQILALNLLMVTAGIFVASVASGLDLTIQGQRWQFLILAMAILLTFLLNTLLLRRRFEPLERLLSMMERVDLSRPGRRLELDTAMRGAPADIQRLAATFNRMLERLERERRRSGEMVLAAQEEERKRIARDLHDEVNQALTALLLRIEAAAQDAPPELQEELAETKRIANRAMSELLDLARQLRPTALDDHGLVAALRTHVREQDRRGPASAHFWADPTIGNIGALVCLIESDNANGFAFGEEAKGLILSGIREPALLVDGTHEIDPRPGKGTTDRLDVPITEPVRAGGNPALHGAAAL